MNVLPFRVQNRQRALGGEEHQARGQGAESAGKGVRGRQRAAQNTDEAEDQENRSRKQQGCHEDARSRAHISRRQVFEIGQIDGGEASRFHAALSFFFQTLALAERILAQPGQRLREVGIGARRQPGAAIVLETEDRAGQSIVLLFLGGSVGRRLGHARKTPPALGSEKQVEGLPAVWAIEKQQVGVVQVFRTAHIAGQVKMGVRLWGAGVGRSQHLLIHHGCQEPGQFAAAPLITDLDFPAHGLTGPVDRLPVRDRQ
jgi:hypothetical protein